METPKKASCANFEFLREFKNGDLDYRGFPEIFPEGIQCIRIVIDPPQKTWVAISEIAVFTMDEENLDILQQEAEKVLVTNATPVNSNNIDSKQNTNDVINQNNVFRFPPLPNSIPKSRVTSDFVSKYSFNVNKKNIS